jgi:integrase
MPENSPIGIRLSSDVEFLGTGRTHPYRARVRWSVNGQRRSKSFCAPSLEAAKEWLTSMTRAAQMGLSPTSATMTLGEYGETVMTLATRGLELKTLDPYLSGWRMRVVPALGHLAMRMVTTGAVDRAVHAWIADGAGRSSVKNSLAILVRVMEQAVRDGIVDRNPARITGWQTEFRQAEDELDDPRSLALPNWQTLTNLTNALVARSAGEWAGWGEIVIFAACTAARIGEVSGVQARDIDPDTWIWTVRRQTTPGPGGLIDKGTKGKRARPVPIIPEIQELVERRIRAVRPTSRLFTGPRGGRITTAVLRDATHWDDVVTALGLEHLRRHDLRHTGLTWMADAGVPLHVLRRIAGHGSLSTTQRYLHPNRQLFTDAGKALSAHLNTTESAPNPGNWSTAGPQLRIV